jgi:hypothetical protein
MKFYGHKDLYCRFLDYVTVQVSVFLNFPVSLEERQENKQSDGRGRFTDNEV